MAHLCVVLLHSTDEPDLAVAGLSAAHAAVSAGRKAALYLAAEGVRVGVRGVAEALSGHGRPDLAGMLGGFVESGGLLLLSGPCFRERGFEPGAVVPGATLVEPEALSALVEEGYAAASF